MTSISGPDNLNSVVTENTPLTPPAWPPSQHNWRGMAGSIIIHAAIFLAIVALGLRSAAPSGSEDARRVSVVLAQVDESQQVEYLSDPTESQDTTSDPESEVLPSDAPPASLPIEDPLADSLADAMADLPKLDAPGMADIARDMAPRSRAIELSDADRELIAAEQARFALEANQGSEAALQVFGSGMMTGRRFVFAIDRSGSMGGRGLGVLEKAVGELSRAIAELEPHHYFQIVAYNHRTTLMNERRLLPASEENKSQVADFVTRLAPHGGTEHESALIVALSLRPDVIVLMNDGDQPYLNQGQLANIRRIARGTPIHCIEFGAGPKHSDNYFMRQLATENNGTYRYIDVRNWDR